MFAQETETESLYLLMFGSIVNWAQSLLKRILRLYWEWMILQTLAANIVSERQKKHYMLIFSINF